MLAAHADELAALEALGRLMWSHHQNASIAQDYFKRAVEFAPANPDLRLLYAMTLHAMKRMDEAVEQYVQTARIEENPQRLAEIAARLKVLGRESEAGAVEAQLKKTPPRPLSPSAEG